MKQPTAVKEYQTSTGLIVTVKPVQPILIQRVSNAVKQPERPTYEVKTLSGKVEHHPLDELAAQQTEGYTAVWEQYLEDRSAALSKRNEMVTNAVFVYGTELDPLPVGWEAKHLALGIDVPDDPDMKRALYLATMLPTEDVNGIVTLIMSMSGVSEEAIAAAESAF